MRRLNKCYTISDYWIDISLSANNPILDLWICRDKHVCVGDKFPFWNFRIAIFKLELRMHPNIF